MKFLYCLGSSHFPYRVKKERFQKVFSKLKKIVPQTVIRLFKLTDFYPDFYRACLFAEGWETRYFLGIASAIWVFFRVFYIRSPPRSSTTKGKLLDYIQ